MIAEVVKKNQPERLSVAEAVYKPTGHKCLVVVNTEPAPEGKMYVNTLFFVDPDKKMMADFELVVPPEKAGQIAEKH